MQLIVVYLSTVEISDYYPDIKVTHQTFVSV